MTYVESAMRRSPVPMMFSLALIVMAMALAGCGGGSSAGGASSGYVVKVGEERISQSEVEHWMGAIAGGDFFEIGELRAPKGIVTGSSSGSICSKFLSGLFGADSKSSRAARAKVGPEQIALKCAQLRSAIQRDATGFLIATHVVGAELAELGTTVSDEEVQRKLASIKAEAFPTEAKFKSYLADRGWSAADEAYIVKKDALSGKLIEGLRQRYGKGGEEALVAYVHKASAKWRGKTTCRDGYVVESCEGYVAGKTQSPSAALLIEEFGRLRSS
jgi:hypothetical protein